MGPNSHPASLPVGQGQFSLPGVLVGSVGSWETALLFVELMGFLLDVGAENGNCRARGAGCVLA